ncbi:unnamed protein product [Ceutorhynchus assimilis]|uniref:ornithine decarboxylase n=1 Tax=Ceutorhynchus assimilis TaxID=467358 RepID=A0A9N9QIW3_9CUCU|nr:unnamed protein product [Ceutorhynchus assimilis]
MKLQSGLEDFEKNPQIWSLIEQISSDECQDEAFYLCNIDEIIEKHRVWTSELPKVAPHYAVKCNDDIVILKVLASLGACFDCASQAEISKVVSIGVTPDRIVFANPAKPISHIRYAASVGVSDMTFDSESELYKIRNVYPHARLIIRIRVDAVDAQCPLGNKFGCDPIVAAPRLLRLAESLNLNVIGISFHVGSGCREPAVFRRAIKSTRDLYDYSKTLGFDFSVLDIGGGYPGVRGSSINEIANIVNNSLDEYFNDVKIRVIAEPGRFYVASAYTLTCNIHSIKNIYEEDDKGNITETHRMYYIDDGVYGSFNCILYDHQLVKPIPLVENLEANKISSSIWGPTCDGLDQVIEEIILPEMNIGECIVFEDMGAYTLPVASPFNGFPVPKVYYVFTSGAWSDLKETLALPSNIVKIIEESNIKQNQYNPERKTSTIFVDSAALKSILVGST